MLCVHYPKHCQCGFSSTIVTKLSVLYSSSINLCAMQEGQYTTSTNIQLWWKGWHWRKIVKFLEYRIVNTAVSFSVWYLINEGHTPILIFLFEYLTCRNYIKPEGSCSYLPYDHVEKDWIALYCVNILQMSIYLQMWYELHELLNWWLMRGDITLFMKEWFKIS